jgi:CheY-like chemotaxis protein
VNRDVLRRQLALLGCACDVVGDGQEALHRLEAGGVSLVLTDCHMPVLDGFGLTRAIRGAEQRGDGGRLPVVAITANAMDGEGDRCIAAGMDAYLTKPVDVARLAAVLDDLLPVEPVRPPAAIDLSVLHAIVGDDAAGLLDVLGTCAASIREQAALLVAGVEAGEVPAVAGAAHRIAGAAASVGAARLATLARAVELSAPTGQDGALHAAVDWLRTEIDVVVSEVEGLEAARE